MNDYRANETIHDVMLRASNVPMVWEDFEDKDKWAGEEYVLSDLEPENPLNYPVVIEGEPPESAYVFRVDVMGVPSEVCERIISKMPNSIDLIKVGKDAGPNPSSDNANAMDCYLDRSILTDMSFYFYSDENEKTVR